MSIVGSFIVPHPPLIIPEVGKGGEEQIKKTSSFYESICKEIMNLNPDTIIISSPHAPYYKDAFFVSSSDTMYGDFSRFGASNVSFDETIDIDLVNLIKKHTSDENIVLANDSNNILDHGTMVPLYFIHKYLEKCNIVVVGLSNLPLMDNYKFGKVIKNAVDESNKRVVFVASGDLSHKLKDYGPYGFTEKGPYYDRDVMMDCGSGNFGKLLKYDEAFLEEVAQCGHRSFCIMAGALDGIAVKSRFFSHEDVTGVGYGICSFYPTGEDESRKFGDINEY